MEKRSRWSIDNHDIKRIPGPSLETLWIPAGWGKQLNRSQSHYNLKEPPRQLRSSSSQMLNQLQPKRSVRNIKSMMDDGRDPIGLAIMDIPHWVNVEAIISIFSRFGSIINVGIDKQAMNATVDFESPISIKSAINELQGKIYFGGPLILKERFDTNRIVETARNIRPLNENIDASTIYISSLPTYLKKVDLNDFFGRFGSIQKIVIGNKGTELNFAMITFKSEESSSMAMDFVKDQKIFGLESIKAGYARKLRAASSNLNLINKYDIGRDVSLKPKRSVNQLTRNLEKWKGL